MLLVHFSYNLRFQIDENKSQNSSAQNPFAKMIAKGNGTWPYYMVNRTLITEVYLRCSFDHTAQATVHCGPIIQSQSLYEEFRRRWHYNLIMLCACLTSIKIAFLCPKYPRTFTEWFRVSPIREDRMEFKFLKLFEFWKLVRY